MVDARGYGRSDAPEQGYNPINMAGALASVITGLDLQKPAVLGHSIDVGSQLSLTTS
jgi:pimeloyl-ACP methyl ester carboxylesterase